MRRLFAVCAGAALAATPVQSYASSWIGARLLRIEPSSHPAASSGVQLPILFYEAVAPERAHDGQVWIHDRQGWVRRLTPYLGETGRWRVPGGLEAPTLGLADGRRMALDREGTLWLLDGAAPGSMTAVADGLPVAVGVPCRSGVWTFWPDSDGGVAVLGPDGVVAQRFQGELYRAKRMRGGGAAGCSESDAVVALVGGRIAAVSDGQVVWATTPQAVAGAEFAPRIAVAADRWLLCTRSSRCLAVARRDGAVLHALGAGSFDGPLALDYAASHFAIAGSDGRVRVVDAELNEVWSVDVGAKPLWLFALEPDGVAVAAGPLWAVSSDGDLYRLTPGVAERVYRVPSGMSSGGRLLPDGTGLLLSNFGALHVFRLQ